MATWVTLGAYAGQFPRTAAGASGIDDNRGASRKGFHYDYQRRESSWMEAGEKRLYTFEDWKATTAHRNR